MRILGNYLIFLISVMEMVLADNDDESQISKELLKLHNDYRKKHNANPLVLDQELTDMAMKMAKNFGINPDSDVIVGSNVFFEQHISTLNARNAFFSWYNKGEKYTDQDDVEMRSETSSFTQIVWKSTEKMGVAVFKGKYYVTLVATYSPEGNIPDQYMANVEAITVRKNESSSSQRTKKQKTGNRHHSSKLIV